MRKRVFTAGDVVYSGIETSSKKGTLRSPNTHRLRMNTWASIIGTGTDLKKPLITPQAL